MLEEIKFKLDECAKEFVPKRAYAWDAGIDIMTPHGFTVPVKDSYNVHTGAHVEVPEGYVCMIKSKSGLNTKRNIVCEGVVDAGFTGEIVVKLYNHGAWPAEFDRGDKIAQLVIMPVETPKVVVVDEIASGERGDNGYGSTGK